MNGEGDNADLSTSNTSQSSASAASAPFATQQPGPDRRAAYEAWYRAFPALPCARETFLNRRANLPAVLLPQGQAQPAHGQHPRILQHQRPDGGFPREEDPARACMVPPDESTCSELRTGSLLPTVHFRVPFTAADGRQVLIAMPGDCIPCYHPHDIAIVDADSANFNFYDFHGLERPTNPEQRIAYVPFTPIFSPRNEGHPVLLDEHRGWLWPLLPYSALTTRTLPWVNRRGSHYVAGPPAMRMPFDSKKINDRLRGTVVQQTSSTATGPANPLPPRSDESTIASAAAVTASGQGTLQGETQTSQAHTGEHLNRNERRRRAQQQRRQQPPIEQHIAAPQAPPSLQSPPDAQLTRLHIMPADHLTEDEVRRGASVPTAHYTLPFPGPHGAPSLLAMPAKCAALVAVANHGPASSEESQDEDNTPEEAHVPISPYYVPRGGTTKAHVPWLYDDVQGFAWSIVPVASHHETDLSWRNARGAAWLATGPLLADIFSDDPERIGPLWALPPEVRCAPRGAEEVREEKRRIREGLEAPDAQRRATMAPDEVGDVYKKEGEEESAGVGRASRMPNSSTPTAAATTAADCDPAGEDGPSTSIAGKSGVSEEGADGRSDPEVGEYAEGSNTKNGAGTGQGKAIKKKKKKGKKNKGKAKA